MTTPRDTLHVISLGAGVQSSTMALMAARGEIGPMPNAAIFADTGWEPKAVYDWLDWLEKQLPYPVWRVSRGNLRDKVLKAGYSDVPFYTKKGLGRRQCTWQFKLRPIQTTIREKLKAHHKNPVKCWVGISTDEYTRMKISSVKYIENVWPLIAARKSRSDCLLWMERNGYPTPPRSACLGCPFKSNNEWRHTKKNEAEWAQTVADDYAIRNLGTSDMEQFMHKDMVPLDKADLSTAEDRGQYSFLDECEGMCGV